MAAEATFTRLLAEHQRLLRQFAITELDLAITFCERALTVNKTAHTSGDGDGHVAAQTHSFSRNRENALKAYDSAIRSIQRSQENIENDPEIAERMRKLRPLLAALPRD